MTQGPGPRAGGCGRTAISRPAGIALGLVIGLSFAAKVALWLGVLGANAQILASPDTATYHATALALLEHGSYALSPERASEPQVARTPGYPTFLAASYAALGPEPARAVEMQILLSLITIALLFEVARRRWNSAWAGVLAAGYLALDLISLLYSMRLLTETLASTMQTLLMLVGLRAAERIDDWRNPLLLGTVLALCTLVRPTTYYAALPFAVWLGVVALRKPLPARRALVALALFATPIALGLGGWTLRNWLWTGEAEYSLITGPNLLFYKAAGVVAMRDGIPVTEAQRRLGKDDYYREHAEAFGPRAAAVRADMRREAGEILIANPGLYLATVAAGATNTLVDSGRDTLFPIFTAGLAGTASRFTELHLLALYAGFAAGLAALVARNRSWAFDALTLGTLIYVLIATGGPEAHHRYRVPLVPILALYAGGGLWSAACLARERWREARR